MKPILHAILLLILLAATQGCATMLIGKALDKDQNLSPEQIKAYNEVGHSVYGCFQVGGPPPLGNMVTIVLPKGATATFRFSDNCHILP